MRFAPLIRVSTEAQEKQGESLHTQKKQIIQYVTALNGTIPDDCWKYSGQEHSTPGYERKNLDRLLLDSSKNIFDAVIVVDASRWSRDNLKSEQGLEILKQNDIKFFVGATQYDLYNPEQKFSLALFTNINQMVAMQNALKSVQNKIELVKQNILSSGRLPFGRTFDKSKGAKGWGIDKEKQDKLKIIAKKYLKGTAKINEEAIRQGLSPSTVRRTLKYFSGDEWTVEFKSKKPNGKPVTFTMKVPRLLPEQTIVEIRKKLSEHRDYGPVINDNYFFPSTTIRIPVFPTS